MYLKTALSNIRRAPFQATAAIFVLAITFFVATVISVLIYSSAQIVNYFETRPQVIAYLKNTSSNDDVNNLKNKLANDSRIKDIKYVSKEDALAIYKNATSENPLLGELVTPSIFPASLEFSIKDLNTAQQIISDIKKESTVDSVEFSARLGNEKTQKEVIDRLARVTFYVRVGGLVLASLLGITSFLVLMMIVGMRVTSRKGDIETLKLMGATAGFIRGPILLEAIIYVVFGVLIGWILALILVLYATPTVIHYFAQVPVLPHDSASFFELNLVILGVEFAVGLVIAILGGLAGVSRAISK